MVWTKVGALAVLFAGALGGCAMETGDESEPAESTASTPVVAEGTSSIPATTGVVAAQKPAAIWTNPAAVATAQTESSGSNPTGKPQPDPWKDYLLNGSQVGSGVVLGTSNPGSQ